jgi:transcriptional regulator with XRE-family HTH domain
MATTVGQGETFGTLLRRHRQVASLSQEQLAAQAQLSADDVSAVERGKRGTPRPDTVAMLVQALALSGEERAAFVDAAQRGPVASAATSEGSQERP